MLVISLRKKPTIGDATTCFATKWRLRNERRNSILMTRVRSRLRGLVEINLWCGTTNQIRSITQIWVVTHHQYGISALVSQTSFGKETSGSVAKCRLFSQTNIVIIHRWKNPRQLFMNKTCQCCLHLSWMAIGCLETHDALWRHYSGWRQGGHQPNSIRENNAGLVTLVGNTPTSRETRL